MMRRVRRLYRSWARLASCAENERLSIHSLAAILCHGFAERDGRDDGRRYLHCPVLFWVVYDW
jgi:hypothetical protein